MSRLFVILGLALLIATPFVVCEDQNNGDGEEEQQDVSLHWFQDDATCGTPYARGYDAGYSEGYGDGYQAYEDELAQAQQDANNNANQKNQDQNDGEGQVLSFDAPECVVLDIELNADEQNNNNNQQQLNYAAFVGLNSAGKIEMQVWSSEASCQAYVEATYAAQDENANQNQDGQDQNQDGQDQNQDGQNQDGQDQNQDGQNQDGQDQNGQDGQNDANDGQQDKKKKDGENKEDQQDGQEEDQGYLVRRINIACGDCYQPLSDYTFYVSVECMSSRAISASYPNRKNKSSSGTSKAGAGFIGVLCGAAVAVVAVAFIRKRSANASESRPIRSNVRSYQQQDE